MSLHWIAPAALVALAAAAGPVIVHLLRRQRAPRVPFPTIQFLSPTQAAAARLQRPSDLALLALRMAAVALAALAAAQPFLETPGRRAAWQDSVARALLVDSSPSALAAGPRIEEVVAAQRQDPSVVQEVRTADLAGGIRQAARSLQTGAAGEIEIVVVSDFQAGALSRADVADLPSHVGLRFVAVDGPARPTAFPGMRSPSADGPPLEQRIVLDGSRTRVELAASSRAGREPAILAKPDQEQAVRSLRRVVASAGAPELPADRALTVVFAGAELPAVERLRPGWMIQALIAARANENLQRLSASRTTEPDGNTVLPPAWTPVITSASSRPLLALGASRQDLVAWIAAAPGDFAAAAALRALLESIPRSGALAEHETERLGASQLAEWTRPPEPLPASGWKAAPPGDARWLWAAALFLLGVETIVRRERRAPEPLSEEEPARVA